MVTNDELNCPDCGGVLKYYDKVSRIIRTKARETRWVKIRRFHCTKCGRFHRELPDYISPYKQYESEIIQGVLKGIITCKIIGHEDYPCEMIMIRWKASKFYMFYYKKNAVSILE